MRWAHIMFGILWIGTSFYFVWLDASLRKRKDDPAIAGESWMVHGGGFYQAEKYVVAPDKLPEELHWFKYEAYFTWVTGIVLMAILYYWGAETYLISDNVRAMSPELAIAISVGSLIAGWVVYDLICRSPLGQNTAALAVCVFVLIVLSTYFYANMFAGRAAYLHIGAFIGTIMAANVFFIIIPNQKKTVAALIAGEEPEARFGMQAKQRSLHNNYLTLPVVFMMISNHYPITYGHPLSWLIAVGVVVAGGLIRHFYNQHDAGALDWKGKIALPAAGLAVVALVAVSASRVGTGYGEEVEFAQVRQIVNKHCINCHSATPTEEGFEEAPLGVAFDVPLDIRKYAAQINAQSVLTDTMPLGNMTEMTQEERDILGAWVAQGAEIE
jgi:uncharacterized membrane protein